MQQQYFLENIAIQPMQLQYFLENIATVKLELQYSLENITIHSQSYTRIGWMGYCVWDVILLGVIFWGKYCSPFQLALVRLGYPGQYLHFKIAIFPKEYHHSWKLSFSKSLKRKPAGQPASRQISGMAIFLRKY